MGVDRAALVADPAAGSPPARRARSRTRAPARRGASRWRTSSAARASGSSSWRSTRGCSIPRPETEHLVEAALDAAAAARGWSTSARARARSRWRSSTSGRTCGWSATESSAAALEVARANAARLGLDVECVEGDLLDRRRRPGRRGRLQPAVRARGRARCAPEVALRAAGRAVRRRRTGSRCSGGWRRRPRDGAPLRRVRGRRGAGGRGARRCCARRVRAIEVVRRPRRASSAWSWRRRSVTDAAGRFERCIARRRRRRLPGRHGLRPRLRSRGRATARRAALRAQGPPAATSRGGDVLRARAGARRAARARPAHRAAARAAAARRRDGAAPQPARPLPAGVRAGPGTLGLRVPDVPPRSPASGRCCRARRTSPAGRTRGGSRTCPRRSARAPTSCSTAASCPGTPSTVVDLRGATRRRRRVRRSGGASRRVELAIAAAGRRWLTPLDRP